MYMYLPILNQEIWIISADVRKFLRKREESVPAFIQLLAPEGGFSTIIK